MVYLLDGDLFPLLAPTHLFLHYDENLPEGHPRGHRVWRIRSGDQQAQYRFHRAGRRRHGRAGWGARFLAFLRDQLIPEVERRYATDPARRILLGQSRGGYFVLWSAREAPDLFWGRIASNPARGSGPRAVVRARDGACTRTDLQVAVVTGTREDEGRRELAHAWVAGWSARADVPWQTALLETGSTTPPASAKGYRRAMLWLFRDADLVPRR